MSPVAYRLRAEARAYWASWVGVMLLTGLVLGLSTALVAGAHRTDRAFSRFLAPGNPSDLVLVESADFGVTSIDLDAAAALPGVERTSVSKGWFSVLETRDGRVLLPGNDAFLLTDSSHLGDGLDRALVVEGRAADPGAIGEAVVSFELAERFGLGPGDGLRASLISASTAMEAQLAFLGTLAHRLASPTPELFDYEPVLDGPRLELEIVGVVAAAMEFPPRSGALIPLVRVTPAFAELVGEQAWSTSYLHVGLAPSTNVDKYVRQVEAEVAGDAPLLLLSVGADQAAAVQRAFHLQAQGFLLLGGLFGLAGIIILGQASARLVRSRAEDARRLRQLGWDTSGLVRLAAGRGLFVAVGGAVLAVALAFLLSPVWPIGAARYAELAPGFALDAPVVLAGIGTILLFMPLSAVAATLVGRRQARRRPTPPAFSTVGPLESRVGVAFALTSTAHGGKVPLRSSLASVTVAVSLLAFLLVFTQRLDRLASTPEAYGWSWDMQIGTPGQPAITGVLAEGLSRNGDIRAAAAGTVVSLEIQGQRVDALGVAPLSGSIEPTILAGAAPALPNEIALGRRTLRAIGRAVGDLVDARVGERVGSFIVVGEVVVPDLGTQGRLGTGGFLTMEGVARLVPEPVANVVLVEFVAAAGSEARTNVRSAVTPVLTREAADSNELDFADPGIGPELALVVLPALVVVATVANGISTSVRRRGRELGTLRALGWTRSGVRRTIFMQAATTGVLALIVGLPSGVALVRVAWSIFTSGIGVDPAAGSDLLTVVGTGVLVLILALVASLVPARLAHRWPPAMALRRE